MKIVTRHWQPVIRCTLQNQSAPANSLRWSRNSPVAIAESQDPKNPRYPCFFWTPEFCKVGAMKKAPVGIGIVGTGFARTTQIPGFRDCMGAKIVAVASRNRERAEAVAKEFGIEYVTDDWQELVAHNDVDLVSVVTPPSTHMEITLAALDQRKAVLCEKPMALNAGEAARMAEKAKAAGVLALIDHELRFLNSRRVMRGMLQNGTIGVVRHSNYVFRSDYRGIADRAWDWWSDEEMG